METCLFRHLLPIVESLIKITVCSDKQTLESCYKEITDVSKFLTKLRFKSSGKSVNPEHLNKALLCWLDSPEELEERIKDYKDFEHLNGENLREHNIETTYKEIRNIVEKLFLDISKGTFTEFNQTYYNNR